MSTIIYIGPFELPDKDAAAHRVMNNSKILKSLGYDIVFIDVDRSKSIEYDVMNNMKKKQNIKNECWTRKYPSSIKEWINYILKIDDLVDIIEKYSNIEYLIVYNYQSIPMNKLIKYCKKKKIKVISDCTEWYDDKRLIKWIDTELRMRYINRKSDGIICISTYLYNYYKKNKTVLLPPLIDNSEDKWNNNRVNNYSSKIKFVYSGNPGKNKDKLNYVIENLLVINKDNYELDIVGVTVEEYLNTYPEHCNIIKKIKNNIKFHGKVPHEKSIEFMQKSDFLIFIRENTKSNNAGFSTKFVECMTIGTPVITTKTSDLNLYLKDKENGFFIDFENKKEQKKTLEYILNLDRYNIEKLKENCNRNNKFDYRHYKNTFKEFLESI